MKALRLLAPVLLALAVPGAAAGSTLESADFPGSHRGAFLTRGLGARAAGMAEAFTAVANDASAVMWNPGGTGCLQVPEAVAMYDSLGQGIMATNAAGTMPMGNGVAGLGLAMLSSGSFETRDETGARMGTASATDVAITATYAWANPPWLGLGGWWGGGVDYVRESAGGAMFGGSLGAVATITPEITGGLAILHIGPARDGFSLPAMVKGGCAYTYGHLGTGAVDLGYDISTRLPWVALGAEWTPTPIAMLRLGYKLKLADQGLNGLNGLTAGLGVRWSQLGLDYAYQPFGDLTTSHRIAFVYGMSVYRRPPVIPVSTDAEYKAAMSAYRKADYDGALAHAKEAAKADPSNAAAWQMAGNCLYAKGDTEGALAFYEKSLSANYDNPRLQAFVDKAKAAAAARKAATPEANYQEALASYTAGKYDAALEKAGAIVQANPSHWQAWQVIGSCQYAKGDRDAAIKSIQYSLYLNPNNPELKAFLDSISGEGGRAIEQ
jgi:Tfp pilus assembly protein PilF